MEAACDEDTKPTRRISRIDNSDANYARTLFGSERGRQGFSTVAAIFATKNCEENTGCQPKQQPA